MAANTATSVQKGSPQAEAVLRRNNVKSFGKGQPMVFAHGFGCDQNMWRFVVQAFEKDHQIVLFDLVGMGRSDASAWDPKKYETLDGYATDVLEVCEALGLKHVIFVGHSVSAMIGALAAARRPELFAHLIMVGPSPRYIDAPGYRGGFSSKDIDHLLETLDANYLGWSSQMAPVIMGNPDRPELGQELTNSFCQTDPEIARHFARVTFLSDNREDLARVRTPSLVLQCSDDPIAPDHVGEYVHKALPRSRFRRLKATGHCPNLSAPAETVDAIREYLAAAGSA